MELTKTHFELHYWPSLTGIWFILTFAISYAISVGNGHVSAYFPFISDTGTLPPESCIFGQMMNIGALLLTITVYIRERQVAFALRYVLIREIWIKMSFWFGILSCFGISLVANFQQTNELTVHFIGASLAFGIGSFYFLVQTKISFSLMEMNKKIPDVGVGKCVVYVRLLISLCLFPLYLMTMILATLSIQHLEKGIHLWWTPESPGYELHITSSFCEWTMAAMILLYILSFTKEFKTVKYQGIQFVSSLDN